MLLQTRAASVPSAGALLALRSACHTPSTARTLPHYFQGSGFKEGRLISFHVPPTCWLEVEDIVVMPRWLNRRGLCPCR